MSSLEQTIKQLFPAASRVAAGYRRFRRWLRQHRLRRKDRSEIFTEYFETNQWDDAESRSGRGSNLWESRVVREILPKLIVELGVRSLVDVPCGDFFWMRLVDLGDVRYTGCDIVGPLTERNRREFCDDHRSFRTLDLCAEVPPPADLVLCRDALVHLSNEDALAALSNIRRSGARYLLTTTFPEVEENVDVATGMWRPINLTRPPFDLPPPRRLIDEQYEGQHGRYRDKSLGLWALDDLGHAPRTERGA